MKTLFRLIIIGILLYLGYNYVKENHPSIAAEIQPVLEKVREISGDLMSEIQQDSKPGTKEKQEKNYTTRDQSQKGNTSVTHTSEMQNAPGSRNQQKEKPSQGAEKSSEPAESKNYNNTAKESAEAGWIKEITRKYSPSSWKLLKYYDELPGKISAQSDNKDYVINSSKPVDTYHYVNYDSKVACVNSMSTNVHEIAHAYHNLKAYDYANQTNTILKWENTRGYIYISPTEGYLVSFPKELLFPSRELAHRIPASRRTFRFDTYINGNNSTQSDGVFGLLNELYAYYFDSRFCYDMYEVYNELYPQPGKGLMQWITYTKSAMAAFYEFHFFIQEYLLYMKETQPADYEKLMQYTPFLKSYGALYKRYSQLVNDYEELIHREKEMLNTEGRVKAFMEGNTLWIQPAGSRKREGVELIHEDVQKLQPVLESKRYDSIKPDMASILH